MTADRSGAAGAPAPHERFWPKSAPLRLTVPRTSLWFNLEVSARRYRDKAAYVFCDRPTSYAELRAQAEAVAGWLRLRAGVRPGDRVLLYLQNSPQFAAAFYGVLRADAVVVPINPMSRVEELAHYLRDAQPRAAICAADVAAHLARADAEAAEGDRLAGMLVTHYEDAFADRPARPAPGDAADAPAPSTSRLPDALAARDPLPEGATPWRDALAASLDPGETRAGPDDLAVMPYTSGTTGFPKGCMHPHRTVMHNTVAGALWAPGSADSTSLVVVPMFHVTGMIYGLHLNIYLGATAIVMARWNRDEAAALIRRYRVTNWINIPTMVIDLLASPALEQYDLSSLARIGGGGAAMPQAVAQRLRERFGLEYMEGYGLSETIAPTHSNPPDRPKLQCLGIPYVSTEARVVDPTTLATLPTGEVGEIVVNGPQVFLGYWRNDEATRAAFVELDGKRWFRTGDLGRIDEEGYYFITDRLKRMINASGFKVWPAEVETMLFKHPAVQEACVIAKREPYRGETPKAYVVLRPEARGGTSAEDVIAWAREHMAAYKVPREVEFVDALPKSGTGKVMWRKLQEDEARRG